MSRMAAEHAEQACKIEQPQRRLVRRNCSGSDAGMKEQCSWRWVVSYIAVIMAALLLITPCTGQERTKGDPAMTAAMIGRVLARARASGSLVYHGQCQDRGGTWDLPALSSPKQHETNLVQMLR